MLRVQRTDLMVWVRGVSFIKPNDCPSERGQKYKEIEQSEEKIVFMK